MRPFVLGRKVRSFQIAAQNLRAGSAGLTAPGDTHQRAVDGLHRRGDGGGQKCTHPFTRFMHCQSVQHVGRIIHDVHARAAVDVRIDIGRAKQLRIARRNARRNGFNRRNRAAFNA